MFGCVAGFHAHASGVPCSCRQGAMLMQAGCHAHAGGEPCLCRQGAMLIQAGCHAHADSAQSAKMANILLNCMLFLKFFQFMNKEARWD